MIRVLIKESYGGKIDDDGDFQTLTNLVRQILTPAAFDNEYKLVDTQSSADKEGSGNEADALTVPEGTGIKDFMEWVNALPEREPPTYLGLPANAERLLLVDQGRSTIQNVHHITHLLDEGEQLMAEEEAEET